MTEETPPVAPPAPPPAKWEQVLAAYRTDSVKLFGNEFLARWGAKTWAPSREDEQAAAKLHMEINSRITSQRLGYRDGVEQTALDSVYALFQGTRDICTQHPLAVHFDAIAWHVLNTRVRPFTAKWHRASHAGALKALDATDEFRAELTTLQPVLRSFDDLLLHIRDGVRPTPAEKDAKPSEIREEMSRPVAWGIPEKTGGMKKEHGSAINALERSAVESRRKAYRTRMFEPNAVGLALSGGGIRSATFSLGVLIALAGRGLLHQFDYLSTVSGGGYLGSFLSAFLNSDDDEAEDQGTAKGVAGGGSFSGGPTPQGEGETKKEETIEEEEKKKEQIGLERDQLPFKREGGEAAALRHLRHHSKYLATGSWWERIAMVLAQLYGMVLNGLAIVLIAVTAAAVERVLRTWPALDGRLGPVIESVLGVLLVCAVLALVFLRLGRQGSRAADWIVALPAMVLVALLCWRGVDQLHGPVRDLMEKYPWWPLALVGVGVILFAASAASRAGQRQKVFGVVLVLLSVVAVPLFLLGIYLAAYAWAQVPTVAWPLLGTMPREEVQWGSVLLGWLLYYFLLDINLTSPHRHYRAKLAEAYLIKRKRLEKPTKELEPKKEAKPSTNGEPSPKTEPSTDNEANGDGEFMFDTAVCLRLSKLIHIGDRSRPGTRPEPAVAENPAPEERIPEAVGPQTVGGSETVTQNAVTPEPQVPVAAAKRGAPRTTKKTGHQRVYRNLRARYLRCRQRWMPARSTRDQGIAEPTVAKPHRGPYHLINCALNVPGSENSAMQGRLTDFFLFSPAFCGSPLLGYYPTKQWEDLDRHLDLGTAMAISGAAAAPQMGLGTMTQLRFWLALLNVRLGYWVRNPGHPVKRRWIAPGLWYLLQEMLGIMNEKRPWVHVSDGGHIENLGVYELLRRRCKYIVAVDGEQDPQMTFQGLTRLQRLAAIDLGVQIDIDLDDLRLNEQGLSRSHFRFCRIRYPSNGRGSDPEYGYLLYLKLSLTGNEGEFIRRYRHDEPAFPHHTTADQFFSEEQFEAYRSLGEHAGNNLFLRAIVAEEWAGRTELTVDEWFQALGENLLEPLPPAAAA